MKKDDADLLLGIRACFQAKLLDEAFCREDYCETRFTGKVSTGSNRIADGTCASGRHLQELR